MYFNVILFFQIYTDSLILVLKIHLLFEIFKISPVSSLFNFFFFVLPSPVVNYVAVETQIIIIDAPINVYSHNQVKKKERVYMSLIV